MIKSLQIAGLHLELTPDIELYVDKKIGSLDRFIPKNDREATKVEVKLKESKSKSKEKFICEVIFHMPHGSITVTDKATSVLAAIDLVEDRLKVQLKKHKDKHGGPRLHRRAINRFIRSN